MKIKVNVKKLSKKISSVEPAELELDRVPKTARELIIASVDACVKQYNDRIKRTESGLAPITREQQESMERAGKIAFGLTFSDKAADPAEAEQTAIQAFRDGLFRMFVGSEELTDENTPVSLDENSEVTFIRLTMLAGRMW